MNMRYVRQSTVIALVSGMFLLFITAAMGMCEVKLVPADGSARDWFGNSLAISGDYAAVGAYGVDENGTESGAVYIYRNTHPGWVQDVRITAPDGQPSDYFGLPVDICGNDVIVGAWGDDDNGNLAGAAYVFHRTDSRWMFQAKLTAQGSGTREGDWFGRAVAIYQDYAVVGAPQSDDYGANSGAAYVFRRNGDTWTQMAKLIPTDLAQGDFFGRAVAIYGNYVAVGAYGDDVYGIDSGAVYVFQRVGDSWFQAAKVVPADGAEGDYFGYALDMTGDNLMVGAYGDDDQGLDAGSAYVFRRFDTQWIQQAKLVGSATSSGDYLGASVAIAGDVAVAGAWRDSPKGDRSGSAVVFERGDAGWAQIAQLSASDGAPIDFFGIDVALSAGRVLVGAYYDDDRGEASGSAYVFDIAQNTPSWFDESWYVSQNPDLAFSIQSGFLFSGWDHFRTYGVLELRNPSATLDLHELNIYCDAFHNAIQTNNAGAAIAAIDSCGGIPEFYDEAYYLTHSPDVADAVQSGVYPNGWEHFTLYGVLELRDPSDGVSLQLLYDGCDPFRLAVLAADPESAVDAISSCPDSSMIPEFFNEAFYLDQNPDVAAAVQNQVHSSGWAHFLHFGVLELRDPSAQVDLSLLNETCDNFHIAVQTMDALDAIRAISNCPGPKAIPDYYDESYYLSNNPDVADAVANHVYSSGWIHFYRYGVLEMRNPSASVDLQVVAETCQGYADALQAGDPVAAVVALSDCPGPMQIPDYYDEAYYLSHNPDVAQAVDNGWYANGWMHFIDYGAVELRNPSEMVNLQLLLTTCEAYATAVQVGDAAAAAEAIAQCPGVGTVPDYYDETYYLIHNPDVADAVNHGVYSSGWVHFMNYGVVEMRHPSELMNLQLLATQCDAYATAVDAGDTTAALAAISSCPDIRTAPDYFDEQFYLNQNPDVADGVQNGVHTNGWAHFMNYGVIELRNPSQSVNLELLTITCDEFRNAVLEGNAPTAAGVIPQCPDPPVAMDYFDEQYYLQENPDVAEAVQNGVYPNGWAHFALYGVLEGRDPSVSISLDVIAHVCPDYVNAVQANDQYTALIAISDCLP